MKPLVIYIDKNTNKVSLTKKEFEDFLKEAYDQGYDDGYRKGSSKNWWNSPTITYTNTTGNDRIREFTTTPNDVPNPFQITCEAHNSIGDSITDTTATTFNSNIQTKE